MLQIGRIDDFGTLKTEQVQTTMKVSGDRLALSHCALDIDSMCTHIERIRGYTHMWSTAATLGTHNHVEVT